MVRFSSPAWFAMPLAVRDAIGADATTAYLQHTVSGAAIVLDDVDTVVSAQGLGPRTAEEAVLEGLQAGWTV